MVSFIDAQREEHGVESICRQLPIAPSTYYEAKARQADPSRLTPRANRDMELLPEIRRVYDESFRVYGAKKVWRQLNREHWGVARCTVERLMGRLGLYGAVRGGKMYRCRSRRPSASFLSSVLVMRVNDLPVLLHVDNRPAFRLCFVESFVETSKAGFSVIGPFALGIGVVDV